MARGATRPLSLMSCTKVSTVVLVAASDFATDSVEGQRGRPSGVIRFDLLKVVGSSPAFLARPEADRPARAASRSTAFQISEWVSIARCATAILRAERSESCRLCRNKNSICPYPLSAQAWRRESAPIGSAPAGGYRLPKIIYKICDAVLWREAERAGVFAGAP